MNNFKRRGNVTIEIRGLTPERFVNLLWRNHVDIKNIRKRDISTIVMDIDSKQYTIVEKLSKEHKIKIRIIKTSGISSLWVKYKNRKAFLLGIALFVCAISYLATYIWSINIITESNISPYEVRKQLAGYGIIPGINKNKIDVFEIEEKLMSENDEIVWARARIQGTKLEIKIAERQTPPNLIEDNTPCDLVANQDGEIVRVYTEAGTSIVTEGEIVKEGEIVVKGEQGKEGEKYAVHAKGDVIAKTFHERKKIIKINETKRVRTGNKLEKVYFLIFGKKVFLKNGLNKFEKYDKIVDNKSWLIKETYYEIKEEKNVIEDVDKLVQDSFDELYSEIVINFDKSVKIIDQIKDVEKGESQYSIRLVVVAEENIAKPKKIGEDRLQEYEGQDEEDQENQEE